MTKGTTPCLNKKHTFEEKKKCLYWVHAASVNGKVRMKASEKKKRACRVNLNKNKTIQIRFENKRKNIIYIQEILEALR